MKFQVQLVPVTQVCLDISFAFKFSSFFCSSRPVVLSCRVSGDVQLIYGGGGGARAGMLSQQSSKVASMRSRSGVGVVLWACCAISDRILERCFSFFFALV